MTQTVSLHVWRVPPWRLPLLLPRLATDRHALRGVAGVRFAKLLGTARGFGPASADLTRWAALIVWEDARASARFEESRPARRWRALAHRYGRIDLQPVSSHGRWAGQQPFEPGGATAGPVLALTRARLRPTAAVAFWRAQRPPARAVLNAPGLLATFGVGEAPVGWPGTVSLWRSSRHLVEFAYRHPDHRRVVEETPGRRWYAEELFARFAVLTVTGDRDVIGWRTTEEAQEVQACR